MLKKKILLVGSLPPPYHGSTIYFSNLLNSKIKEKFEIHHLDTSDHRNLDNLSKLDFTNVYLALKNIIQLFQMLGKLKPDLVYIPPAANLLPYLRDGLFILTASYFSKAKIVIHLHGGKYFRNEFYNKSNIFTKYFLKQSLSNVNTAIVLSNTLKPVFEGLVKNITAIPNGTDFGNDFKPEDYSKKNDGIIKINYLGNLFESKGVFDILNAVSLVIKKNKNVEFNFAGEWPEGEDTKNLCLQIIKKNKIENYVKFHGVVLNKEKEEFLKTADIFVFPSWYPFEGFPLVIIEAMSAGCPVISTKDVGAIPDIVEDGVTGFLVERKNPGQIAKDINILIENKEMRLCMGLKSRERFTKYFTLEKNIDEMINVFNKVLEEKS